RGRAAAHVRHRRLFCPARCHSGLSAGCRPAAGGPHDARARADEPLSGAHARANVNDGHGHQAREVVQNVLDGLSGGGGNAVGHWANKK
nr:hypothetical protein [Tanacetum cinerariifolium]